MLSYCVIPFDVRLATGVLVPGSGYLCSVVSSAVVSLSNIALLFSPSEGSVRSYRQVLWCGSRPAIVALGCHLVVVSASSVSRSSPASRGREPDSRRTVLGSCPGDLCLPAGVCSLVPDMSGMHAPPSRIGLSLIACLPPGGRFPGTVLTGMPLVPEHRSMRQSGTDEVGPAGYNYVNFDHHVATEGDIADELAFRGSCSAGEPAADFTLVRLDDGVRQQLSGLWKPKPLVMEFGSFT